MTAVLQLLVLRNTICGHPIALGDREQLATANAALRKIGNTDYRIQTFSSTAEAQKTAGELLTNTKCQHCADPLGPDPKGTTDGHN